MTKYISLAVILTTIAACDAPTTSSENFVTEADISEANRNTECPVDVSEADRAQYPACN